MKRLLSRKGRAASEVLAVESSAPAYEELTSPHRPTGHPSSSVGTDWEDITDALQGLREIVVPFAFDDPDLLTGKAVYTPTAGERLLGDSAISVTEEFDGTSPTLALISEGGDVNDAPLSATPPLTADVPYGVGSTVNHFKTDLGGAAYFTDATPVVLVLHDGSGGDPGSTQGAGEVRLLVMAKGVS